MGPVCRTSGTICYQLLTRISEADAEYDLKETIERLVPEMVSLYRVGI